MYEFPSTQEIAELSFKKFNSLPKTGKPNKSEWTVLSSIIQFNNVNNDVKVVALGCGTKCLGQSKLCPLGQILNDSHAEVLARRAFLRYLYYKLKNESDTFRYDENERVFKLKDSISFHFFSTQVPCGDACIIDQDGVPMKKRKLDVDNCEVGDLLTTNNVFTGAKLIGESNADPMYQTVGALRTKPGRGDRTLSMSCSDKLSKWNILGIQGAFLDAILQEPIYLKTLNFACEFDVNSMTRAIYERWKGKEFTSERFTIQKPDIRKAHQLQFEFTQHSEKNPSPNGLAWCDVPEDNGPYEVSVNGKKQGITKKALYSKKSCLKISKCWLLEEFCDVISNHPGIRNKLGLQDVEPASKTNAELKEMCKQYQATWEFLKNSYFEKWTEKPKSLRNFKINKES